MKKIILLMTLVLTVCFWARAQESETQLKQIVEIMNQECPADTGDGLVLNKVYMTPANVIFQFDLEDGELFTTIKDNKVLLNSLADIMLSAMVADEDFQMLVNLLVDAKKGLQFEFIQKATGLTTQLTFRYDQLPKAD